MSKSLTENQRVDFLDTLKERFEKNMNRHPQIEWDSVKERLLKNVEKLWSLYQMEITEGEPDVIGYDEQSDTYIFCDCSIESPKGRRSLCYDAEALASRKKHPPKNSALEVAKEMGVEVLNEEEYQFLQSKVVVDTKTSSWLKTTEEVRSLGGAIFGDRRYDRVFIYHNGADSYYTARGFRALLRV